MYLLIVFLPLISALTAGLFGRFIGREGAKWITVGCTVTTFFMSLVAFYEVALAGSPCYFEVMTWIDSEMFSFSWGFLFDSLTVVMLVVVTSVSSLVHLYSTEYMGHDPHLPRFMSYLSLFTFFMLILVTADNFLQMFVGWEGVGLCSYLLINFWFARIQANKAAIKAMLVNRVGDFGLALGIFAIYLKFKSIDYAMTESDKINFALATYNLGATNINNARAKLNTGSSLIGWDALKAELILIDGEALYFKAQDGYSRGQQAIDFVERTREYAVLMNLASCQDSINQLTSASGI